MKTTCIMCPMGCNLEIYEVDAQTPKAVRAVKKDGTIVYLSVLGNTCMRGRDYGVSEYTMPTRMVTTLVKLTNGGVVACKTNKPVEKEKIFDILTKVRDFRLDAVKPIGTVIMSNVDGNGADIIVTSNPPIDPFHK